jgi:hypothetical protein
MFKKIPHSKRKKVKVVEIITEESEHICTEECFKPGKKLVPEGLRRVDLGYIYQDNEGRCYSEHGEGKFLEVTGLTFTIGAGGLHLMFYPAQQLHIHSLGGKTIEKTTVKRNARVNDEFYSTEAAKKLKRKGLNLNDSLRKISSDVKKVIPRAPKRKSPVKGTGRGAPGIPRTDLGKEIVKIISAGKAKKETFAEVIKWATNNLMPVAGPHKARLKKQVDRWWSAIKSTHK